MSDIRSQLPPGVKVDALKTEARKELKDLLDRYDELAKIPHYEVDHPQVMVIYLQANYDTSEILNFVLEQRNRVKRYLLEDQAFEAYEEAGEDVTFDSVMASDIFVDDMKLLNRFNQFFGEVHSILDDVEEEFEDNQGNAAVQKVRDRLKEEFPEESEELNEKIGSPFE